MLRKLLLTVICLSPLLLTAQSEVTDWEAFASKGEALEAKGQWREAINLYNEWYANAQKAGNCTQQEEAIYNKAMAEYSSDQTKTAARTIETFFKNRSQCAPSETAGNLHHKLGVFYYLLDRYDHAASAYQQAIKIRASVLGEEDLSLSRSYHNLGVALKEKESFARALEALKAASHIRSAANEDGLLADTYYEQAAVYRMMGDYTLALDLLKAALPIFQKEHGALSFEVGQAYNEMGITHWDSQQYEAAIQSLKQANDIFTTLYGPNDVDVAKSYINLGNVYDDSGKPALALAHYQKALDIYQEINPESLIQALVLNNMGVVYRKTQNWGQASKQLERSLELKEKILGPGKHQEKAATLDNLGDLYMDQGLLDRGLYYYQSAIINRVPGCSEQDVMLNPVLEEGAVLGGWQKLLTVMISKGAALRRLYREKREQSILIAALETYYRCDEITMLLQRQYETRQSKLFLQEKAMLAYEGALAACHELYQTTSDDLYLQDAFFFMEKSRAVLLANRLTESRAQQSARIPEAVQATEQEFRADIAYCESQLVQLQSSNDTMELQSIQAQLVKLRQQYEAFISELESSYPRYHREKYKLPIVDMERLESYLKNKKSAWLSYFAGQEASYCLRFHHDNWMLVELSERQQWEPKIISLRSQLANHQDPLLLDSFLLHTRQLYAQLWHPIAEGLPERVFISPSGALFALPFELLPKTHATDTGWKQLDYLIRQHQLSYVYSASLLLQSNKDKQKQTSEAFLGVAPSFEGSKLAPLPGNESEVSQIRGLLGGDLLLGGQASKEAFLEQAVRYRILHLSTHASTEDGGWIAFSATDEAEGDSKLYLPELYPLGLQAELAVLSACETAAGTLSRGEGVLSIAHGLSYAGCPSTVASLWPAYHSTTSQLMLDFYQHLKNGDSKDAALRKAKLAYLDSETTDASGAHPALWAAFVHLGMPDPMFEEKGISWWWMIGGVALVGLLIFGIRKARA